MRFIHAHKSIKEMYMKRIATLFFCFVFASNASADDYYDTGRIFVGVDVGAVGLADFSAGIIGGYQYYFTKSYQPNDAFRQGIRGIVGINWGSYTYDRFNFDSARYSEVSSGSLYTRVGVDWSVDFNPRNKLVWGALAGLNIGYFKVFTNDSIPRTHRGFNLEGHIGGSATYEDTHRLELLLGWGYSVLSLRYICMF